MNASTPGSQRGRGMLDLIEWLGNKLPDPALLFVMGAAAIMVMSWVAVQFDLGVQERTFRQAFEPLLTAEGEPVLHEGRPRVLPTFDERGEPVLELVSDRRRLDRLMTRDADGHEHPLTDEHGRAIVVLEGEAGDRPPLRARNLLEPDGLYWCLSSMVDNFMRFPPLGIVLVGMLGIGVAEKTGLLGAALKAFALIVPRLLLTPAIVFLGIMSSLATDAGYVVLPPLAAAMYISVGRSPLVGIAAAFAGVSAGFNANLLITGLDPMLAAMSSQAAQVIDADYVVAPTANWWFMIGSTFVITLTGWFTTALLVSPRLSRKPAEEGGPQPTSSEPSDAPGHTFLSGLGVFVLLLLVLAVGVGPLAWPDSPLFLLGDAYASLGQWLTDSGETLRPLGEWFSAQAACGVTALEERVSAAGGWAEDGSAPTLWCAPPLWLKLCAPALAIGLLLPLLVYALARGGMTPREAAGLGWATFAHGVLLGGLIVLAVLPGSPLYGNSPTPPYFARWVAVVVPLIFLLFMAPGIAYGVRLGVIRTASEVPRLMVHAIAGMAPIIVLAFFAAQFIEYFKYSGLDRMLAMWGGQLLAEAALPAGLLIVVFILVTAVFNLFVGSMSAKYLMFAPIFVPMFMMVGISPELTQAAYRIGDSVSNVITPLNAYLVIVLVFIQKYVPRAGIGTLISLMLPYTIVFAIVWTVMLLVWMQLGWDLGLGGPLYYQPQH